MGPSLATNLAAQRARDTSAPLDWTRTAGSSSSSNPSIPRADPGLRPERSGAAGTDGGQEVLVPHRTPTTQAPRWRPNSLVHAPQGVDGLVAAHPASSGQLLTAEFSAGADGQPGHERAARWQRKNDFLYRIEKLTFPRGASRWNAVTRRRQRTGVCPRPHRRTRPCRSMNDTTRYGS
jgi:hypothetical protein